MKCRKFFLFLLIGVISGCASPKTKLPKDNMLLNKAQRAFANRDFVGAETNYKSLLDSYSESPYRMIALMGLADSYFRQENYMEASWKYRDFYELYPVHRDAAKAHFFEGMSYFNEMSTPDRDPTSTIKAKKQFERLIYDPDFSASPYLKTVENLIYECNELLGLQVFGIGKFYFNTKQYLATISRMNEFIEKYPGMPQEEEAVFMIAESYFLEDNYELADKYYKLLLEKYGTSTHLSNAKNRLLLISDASDRLKIK